MDGVAARRNASLVMRVAADRNASLVMRVAAIGNANAVASAEEEGIELIRTWPAYAVRAHLVGLHVGRANERSGRR